MNTLAHGIGSRGDLPLPLTALVVGALSAIIISFVVLTVAWGHPRFDGLATGRVLGRTDGVAGRVFVTAGRLFGLLVVVVGLGAGIWVTDNQWENITPRLVYVLLWVIVPLLSFVFGDIWRWISPFEALAALRDRVVGEEAGGADAGASRLTLFVPAAGLLVFHWVELAYHASASARILAWMLGAWIVMSTYAALRYGGEGLRSRDPLAVWSRLIGAGGPIFVRGSEWGVRAPFVGLSQVPVQPGIALAIMIVLGGTTFDGVTRTDWWRDIMGTRVGWGATAVNTIGLLLTISVLLVLFLTAIRMMQRAAGTDDSTYDDVFASALLPVAVGYSIAHYFSLAVFEGQFLWIQASDPFARGWDLFGFRSERPNYTFISTTVVAWVQAMGIIIGHLAGVVVGHDRALSELPPNRFERSQLPLIALMMTLTCFGLFLLVEA